jgi:hypothetical protein
MKNRMMAVLAVVMFTAAGTDLRAQSLGQSYADMCSKPAQKTTEACQVMAKALMAKLQGEVATSPTITTSEPRPQAAATRLAWGFLVDFVGKPTFAIDAATGVAKTSSRYVLEWQAPGTVLLRKELGPDGSVLGTTTYKLDEASETVVRALPGLTQTFTVEANGNLTGVIRSGGAVVREKWERNADGYNVWSESNEGHGWVMGNDTYWLPANDATLASAGQLAATFAQVHKARKSAAEVHAAMQGSRTDEEYKAYLGYLAQRAQEWEETKQRRREARNKFFSSLLMVGVAATAAAVNGGDATQVLDGAVRGYDVAHPNDSAATQLGAQTQAAQQQQTARSTSSASSGEPIMGFNNRTCAEGRAAAQEWVGTGGTFQVKSEVVQPDGRCVVQIHNWNSTGSASRQ